MPSPSSSDNINPVTLRVQLSEVISALTFALDLTEGAVPGHALRSCLIGLRLGEAIGLPSSDRAALYYALQLKDVGCSNNASRMTAIVGGDDRALKNAAKLQDWTRPDRPSPRVLRTLWQQTLPGSSVARKLGRLAKIAQTQHANNREMIELRCERGAEIVNSLELEPSVAQAVRHLDEHWNGSGYPDALRGHDIPILSRLCSVAQNLDLFATVDGPDRALGVIRSRCNTWFDPELVRAAELLHRSNELWRGCLPTDLAEQTRTAVLDLDPGLHTQVTAERLDRICEAFSRVVDAKSPFTFRHSMGVMEVSDAIAKEMGMGPHQRSTIRRAALLHDLGKLAVPNSILDKQGKLTEREWEVIRRHPEISGSILRRVPAMRELVRPAEQHHERLDGSGYPYRLRANDLSTPSRLIALADNYAAMAEHRPYRNGMEATEVLRLLSPQTGLKLDPACFEALEAATLRWPGPLPQPHTQVEADSFCYPAPPALTMTPVHA